MQTASLVSSADVGRVLAEVVEEAAELILPYWRAELTVERKADMSPVTEADRRGEELILKRLERLFAGIPVISEEACETGGLPATAP